MTQIINRTLTCLGLAGLLLIDPELGLSRAAEIDPSEKSALVMQCADRIEKWFPSITIQTRELDMEHVKLTRRQEQQLVFIPLKHPQGIVKSVFWGFKGQTETLDLIRLLEQGKIGAVTVMPFLHDPVALYTERINLLDDLKGCQQKEQVQDVLGQCTECRIFEWLDIKP